MSRQPIEGTISSASRKTLLNTMQRSTNCVHACSSSSGALGAPHEPRKAYSERTLIGDEIDATLRGLQATLDAAGMTGIGIEATYAETGDVMHAYEAVACL